MATRSLYLFTDRNLVLLAAVMIVQSAMAASIFPYLSIIATQSFGLSEQIFALALGLGTLASLSGSFYLGIRTDQTGNRRFWALTLAVIYLSGNALMTFAPSIPGYLLTHGALIPIGGGIIGLLYAETRVQVQAWEPRARDLVMSEVRMVFAVPFVGAPIIWGLLIGSGVEPTSIYPVQFVLSIVQLVSVVLVWPKGTPPPADAPARNFWKDASVLLERRVLLPVSLLIVISMGPMAFMVNLGLLFEAVPNRNIGEVGLYSATIAALEVPMMILLPRLLINVRKSRQITVGAIGYTTFLFLLPLTADSWFVWLLCPLAGASAAIILAVPIGYIQDLLSDRPGAASFLGSVVAISGSIVAAVIIAIGATYLSIYWITVISGFTVAFAAGLFFISTRDQGL